MVDATKALGAYGIWTDYATHPGDDGEGYGDQICSMLPTELAQGPRDADSKLIVESRNHLPALIATARKYQEMVGLVRRMKKLGFSTGMDMSAELTFWDLWDTLAALVKEQSTDV